MKSSLTPLRAKSDTKSSKSATSSAPRAAGLETAVQFIKGVGPRLGVLLVGREISTVRDLLTFFPRTYEDRTRTSQVSDLKDGESVTVQVQVQSCRKIPLRSKARSMLEVRCTDATGALSLKWFHSPAGMEKRFVPGQALTVTGTIKSYMGRSEMIHPEITFGKADPETEVKTEVKEDYNTGRIVPVYVEIEGISTRILRRVLWEAVQKFASFLVEDLPERFLKHHGFPMLSEAIRFIHFPPGDAPFSMDKLAGFQTPSHCRLIYEEFFKFEFLVLRRRINMEKQRAQALDPATTIKILADLQTVMPFPLTRDQKKCLDEIREDLCAPHPMNRLVQGDVGSGKTAVTLLAAAGAVAQGAQCALMAPTEILAEQHERSAKTLFGGRLPTATLTGRTTPAERKALLERLAKGEPLLLIGTHALLEDPVVFKNLALIAIDEQHRFGVEQRRTLRNKGLRRDAQTGKDFYPHILVLTATPIPRTLALTAYGDLSVSTIRELPPGRSPVKTRVIHETQRDRAYQQIREELRSGRQAYFIYPLVNESEAEGFTELKSATGEAERLAVSIFPDFKVGMLHGQLRPDEKNEVMAKFKSGEVQILVSTTVVEVGVDVPNATVMVVEHAERFGLSQLHQLRGRVGRGKHASQCFLFTHLRRRGQSSDSQVRLDVLEKTQDGFDIAEADLEIRGPGEFLGTRQSGSLPFKMANLVRDREWLLVAREDALALLQEDPELKLPAQEPLRRYYEREGSLQSERLQTS